MKWYFTEGDAKMAKKHWKDVPHDQLEGKCKLKPTEIAVIWIATFFKSDKTKFLGTVH